MDNVYFKWQECLEELAVRLEAVHDMVDVVSMEFQHEYNEQQVISCFSCIGFCIRDIKSHVDETIKQLAQYNKSEESNMNQ